MADFKSHITASSFLGIAYGAGAHAFFGVPLSTAVLGGGLCGVSGMLPDIDSDSGKPLKESLAFGGAVVAMMTVDRFQQLGMAQEWIVIAGALVYLLVRFAFGAFLKRYTVHRGMFHSLPAAIIFGEIAFLLASGTDVRLRAYKAGAVVLGYLSHLVLDEIYSFEWRRGRPRLKKSFGTALKMFSHKWWATASTYIKLGLLSYIVFCEPGWMDKLRQERPLDWAQNWVQEQTQHLSQEPEPRSDDSSPAPPVADPTYDPIPIGYPSQDPDPVGGPLYDPNQPRTAERSDTFFR